MYFSNSNVLHVHCKSSDNSNDWFFIYTKTMVLTSSATLNLVNYFCVYFHINECMNDICKFSSIQKSILFWNNKLLTILFIILQQCQVITALNFLIIKRNYLKYLETSKLAVNVSCLWLGEKAIITTAYFYTYMCEYIQTQYVLNWNSDTFW